MSPVSLVEVESPPEVGLPHGSIPDRGLPDVGLPDRGLPDSLVSPYLRVVAVLREGRQLKDDTYL